ncbi:MAG TPA: TonB-dependent receptor [Rariglobus sp.]|nr:TonB-dependent receptor [Rariglobus sp.]
MNTPSRSRLAGRLSLACVLAAPLVSSIHGQTVPVIQLDDYVVTARRIAEDSSNVPAYTQVISRDQIEKSDATNLIDLLENEANLQFTSISGSPSNTKVSLRGTGSGGNGRTLVLLDGIRTNRPDIGDFNWLQFSLQNIDSIEIIQGPQGAFYGDNAVGGVIKINTRGEPDKSGGGGQVLVGSDGTFKLAGGYTELFGNAWTSASAGYDTSDGWRDHSGYDDKSASIGAGYDNHKNSVTRINASFLDNHYDQPGYLTVAQFRQDPTQQGAAFSNGWSDYRRVSASNEFGVSPQAKLLTDAGASFVKEYYNGGFGTQFNRTMNGYFFSPKVHFETGDFTFTPGVDVNYDELHVRTTTPVDSTLSRKVLSPYLASEWRATDTLAFSAAYRHEWNEITAREDLSSQKSNRSDDGSAVQLAVNYKPASTLHLYAKYDHTYRFPATDEISYYQGFLGGPGFNQFFNKDLKPETSDNYEIGADFKNHGWSAGTSVYYMGTEDEIFYNVATNLNENLAKTRRVGAQLNAGYDAGFAGLRTRVDYVDAELIKSTPGAGLVSDGTLRMTPALHLTTTAVVRPIKMVEVSLTHKYIGSSLVDDSYAGTSPGRVAGVNLFDAKISYSPSEKWRVFAGVNNLFDRSYVSYATIGFPPPVFAPTTVVYPGQGRFIYAGSSVSF